MISLDEYMTKVFRDRSMWPWQKIYKLNQCNILSEYFERNIPKQIEERLINGEKFEDLMLEHLRNIDSKYILNDLKEYFHDYYNIIENNDIISMNSKKNPKEDKDFLKLIEIYQYNIKKSFKHINNEYDIDIEKNFPKDVTEEVSYYPEDRYIFHITKRPNVNSILENGFRAGYHFTSPKNISKYVWKQYKESHDKEKWKKNYFFYIPDFYLDNNGIKKLKEYANKVADILGIKKDNAVLLGIQLPQGSRVYADKSMPMKDCCFTYTNIPPENVWEIKNTFK